MNQITQLTQKIEKNDSNTKAVIASKVTQLDQGYTNAIADSSATLSADYKHYVTRPRQKWNQSPT